jgi:hypothetical protein
MAFFIDFIFRNGEITLIRKIYYGQKEKGWVININNLKPGNISMSNN